MTQLLSERGRRGAAAPRGEESENASEQVIPLGVVFVPCDACGAPVDFAAVATGNRPQLCDRDAAALVLALLEPARSPFGGNGSSSACRDRRRLSRIAI